MFGIFGMPSKQLLCQHTELTEIDRWIGLCLSVCLSVCPTWTQSEREGGMQQHMSHILKNAG